MMRTLLPLRPAAPQMPVDASLSTAQRDLQRLMQQPAAQQPGAQAAQVWVSTLAAERTASGALQVQDASGQWLAVHRAHSCLVPPEPGDLVQVVQTDSHCWAVAVLQSAQPEQGLLLDAAGQTLTLQAQNLRLQATQTLHQEADTCTSQMRLIVQTCEERQTRIQGTDTTRASHQLTHVQGHHSVHAASATLTASSLLKVDAAQIHMG